LHDFIAGAAGIFAAGSGTVSAESFLLAIQSLGPQTGACGTSSFMQSDTGEQFIRFPLTLKMVEAGEIRTLAQ
jgi:hypothetical protein